MLLNVDGSLSPGPDYPGEEYVPADFVARHLPSELAICRRFLMGISPDRAGLNWRLRELLVCIHASRLNDYLTALDPRITYGFDSTRLFEELLMGPRAVQLSGTSQQLIFVGDTLQTPDTESIYNNWALTVQDSDTGLLVTTNGLGRTNQYPFEYTITDGMSDLIDLPGTGLHFRFNDVWPTHWQITWLQKPNTDLTDVLAIAESGMTEELEDVLFPVGSPEPYATFGNLWKQHEHLPNRLAGLTLAVIYRLNGG